MSHYMDQAKVLAQNRADRLLDDLASRIAINFDNFGIEEVDQPPHTEAAEPEPWRERATQLGLDLATGGLEKVVSAAREPGHLGYAAMMLTLTGVQHLHERYVRYAA